MVGTEAIICWRAALAPSWISARSAWSNRSVLKGCPGTMPSREMRARIEKSLACGGIVVEVRRRDGFEPVTSSVSVLREPA
jgi:hypothetical protein